MVGVRRRQAHGGYAACRKCSLGVRDRFDGTGQDRLVGRVDRRQGNATAKKRAHLGFRALHRKHRAGRLRLHQAAARSHEAQRFL